MKPRLVQGFDYRTQAAVTRPMNEWRDELERAIDAGGSKRRIGGDLSAFDRSGELMFELYDGDSGDGTEKH